MRSSLLLACLLVPALVACGDDGGAAPDAFIVNADAPIDNPPPPPGCDYGELRDATNDDDGTPSGGSPEDTMVAFSASTVLCGKLDSSHFDATSGKVDADAFMFNLPAAGVLYLQMYGTGLEGVDEVRVAIYGGTGFTSLQMSGVFAVNHAALTVPLESGTYEVYIQAYNPTALTADVSYKVKLTPDTTQTDCALVTTGGYAEARDAATNNLGNDMIVVDLDADGPVFTAASSDQPEPSALTIATTGSSRFTGTAEVTAPTTVNSYKDRDTFEIRTGPTTNEISIRTTWTAAVADLDLTVFEKPDVAATSPFELASSAAAADGPSEELVTLAVKPDTSYWVWIGNWNESTGAAAYSTTICGKSYTPPAN